MSIKMFLCYMKWDKYICFIEWLTRKWWKSGLMINFGDNSKNISSYEGNSREGKGILNDVFYKWILFVKGEQNYLRCKE